jgi:hypothetical protein
VTRPANANRTPAALDWGALMSRSATYVDRTRLAACFNGRISLRMCERLGNSVRLQDRLSAVVNDFYALATPLDP